MSLLQVSNLIKTFGGLMAVSDVSFAVEEGSIVGLIGPNGAGKTTVFNLITGNYRPDSGQVLFEDRELTCLPWRTSWPDAIVVWGAGPWRPCSARRLNAGRSGRLWNWPLPSLNSWGSGPSPCSRPRTCPTAI